MALRMITAGPAALSLYHSHQSVGLVKHREPVCFTLASKQVVDCLLVNIQGLKHLVDSTGYEFLFEGFAVDQEGHVVDRVMGFYDAHLRKGHVVMPAGDKEVPFIEIRARAHLMHLRGRFTPDIAWFVRKRCRANALGGAAPARIMGDLGLDYHPAP